MSFMDVCRLIWRTIWIKRQEATWSALLFLLYQGVIPEVSGKQVWQIMHFKLMVQSKLNNFILLSSCDLK